LGIIFWQKYLIFQKQKTSQKFFTKSRRYAIINTSGQFSSVAVFSYLVSRIAYSLSVIASEQSERSNLSFLCAIRITSKASSGNVLRQAYLNFYVLKKEKPI